MRSCHRFLGIVLLGAFGVLGTPTVSSAQDGAAKVYEDAADFSDRKKTIKIRLPRLWKQDGGAKAPGLIICYEGSLSPGEKDRIDAKMWIYQLRDSSRAGLVRFMRESRTGTRKDGSLESGPGWQQVAVKARKGQQVDWFRAVEKDGIVFLVHAGAAASNYDTHGPIIEKMLATFEVTGTVKPPTLPDEWKEKKSGDFLVWSDDWKESGDGIENGLEIGELARKVMSKALKGKPYVRSKPLVKAYRAINVFEDDAAKIGLDEPDVGFNDPGSGAVCFKINAVPFNDWEPNAPKLFIRQYVYQYFGGPPPLWIDWGLLEYGDRGVKASGKPDKPPSSEIAQARRYIEKSPRLDKLFTIHPNFIDQSIGSFGGPRDDQKAVQYMLWSWHWFFRHGKGKKYRKYYDDCLEILQETGDPDKAHAAFEKADLDKMLEDFKAWGEDWD